MPVTFATITRAASGPGAKRTFSFYPQTEGNTVTVAAQDYEHTGPYQATTSVSGTFSVQVPTGTDQGGTELLWKITEKPIDRIAGRPGGPTSERVVGFVTINASIDYDDLIAALVDVTAVDAGIVASIGGMVTAAELAEANAELAETNAEGWATAASSSAADADLSADEALAQATQAALNADGLDVGTVTDLAPGAPPTAAITGTAPNRVINFGIPAGVADDTSLTAIDANAASAFRVQSDARLSATFGAETGPADGYPDSFQANGNGTVIGTLDWADSDPMAGHAEGHDTKVYGWNGHAEGESCIADGKISHAEGNTCICTANDSHAEGNRTVAGRRYYRNPAGGNLTIGSEDAGSGLGVLAYVLIPDDPYGDVTSYFPNPLTDNVTTRYGAGASLDTQGNVYGPTSAASGVNTPAVWSGDTLVTANDLQWAMHSRCILRGSPSETAIGYVEIAKAVYTAGVGTKVYHYGPVPGSSGDVPGIYSSYSPVVLSGGNGQHAEGYFTSAWNYGAHAEGRRTEAWGDGAHSEGRETAAVNHYAHAGGYQTRASGIASRATGQQSVASRDNQQAHSAGKRVANGDSQTTVMQYSKSCVNAGWHEINILLALEEGSYHFDTMVLGRQTAGTAGTVGDAFAYRFSGLVSVDADGSVQVNGGPVVRTLVGRTSGMSGDGLTTGPRMTFQTSAYLDDSIKSRLIARFDSIADTTFWVQSRSVILEFIA